MKRVFYCAVQVAEFQTLMGKLDHVASRDDMLKQAKLVLEEAKELVFAIENESEAAIVKELADCFVTSFGMAVMLNRSGYDCIGAWEATNLNNISKFCTTQTDGFYTLSSYQATTGGAYELRQVDRDKWGVFNDQGKMMKPIGYNKLDASRFTPQYKEPT